MLNKWQRIQFVRSLGLNTEESILVDRTYLTRRQHAFINSSKRFSLRTFSARDSDVHPHYPVVSKMRLLQLMPRLLSQGYSLIVAKCINPRFAEFVGCGYKRGASVTFEIKYGAVTVRSITHDGNIDKTFTTGLLEQCAGDYRLNQILAEMRRTPVTDCIFEFSWYSIPVGWRKQEMIFWEITGDAEKGLIKTEGGNVVTL